MQDPGPREKKTKGSVQSAGKRMGGYRLDATGSAGVGSGEVARIVTACCLPARFLLAATRAKGAVAKKTVLPKATRPALEGFPKRQEKRARCGGPSRFMLRRSRLYSLDPTLNLVLSPLENPNGSLPCNLADQKKVVAAEAI